MNNLPKYAQELIDCGELQMSSTYMKGFERYTFRLYTRLGMEKKRARNLEKTRTLAEKICKWSVNQGAISEIGESDWMWFKSTQCWEKLPYIMLGITDPTAHVLEGAIENQRANDLQDYLLLEPSKIELLNETPQGFDSENQENLIGYYRADHDRYRWWCTWWDGNFELKTPDVKKEIDKIGKEIIFHMFPDGIRHMRLYCNENNIRSIGDEEYNMYYSGELCYYWIRMILRQGDYNIYLKCYKKKSSGLD